MAPAVEVQPQQYPVRDKASVLVEPGGPFPQLSRRDGHAGVPADAELSPTAV